MNLTLNVYDKTGKEVIKTAKSSTYDLSFGTIRKLMALLKIEELENDAEMLKTVFNAWEEITTVLSTVFPDIEEDEWDNVKLKELIPVVVDIAKFSITDTLAIPSNKSKN